ncbi:MAG: 4-hydroxyphenylpyruvate dioxygenase [Myxococcota bacterium]|jgi:4-hydroxyphenylpyruvate dioxygenase
MSHWEVKQVAASEELGIIGVDSFHFFVHEPERSDGFYRNGFGWVPVARSGDTMSERTGQQSTVYGGGDIRVVVSHPTSDTCRAARYLRRHPDGIGSMTFEVTDIERTWDFLCARDATPIHPISSNRTDDGGRYRHFSITTAIGDVSFRFMQKDDYGGFAPGFEAVESAAETSSAFNYLSIDHITSNAPTMAGPKLWMEHVLGMEQCWDIAFHTDDVSEGADSGTGLKSVVMWDPRSGLKFPVNEPLQPFFKEGQINKFVEDNHGAGIQHIALGVDDVVTAVDCLRKRSIEFLHTPPSYYEASEARMAERGVSCGEIAHKLDTLAAQGILIDGSPVNQYLIQIFLKDAAVLYSEPAAGPFFYELIQRCGDEGFGEGNFRALFEAIERDQG